MSVGRLLNGCLQIFYCRKIVAQRRAVELLAGVRGQPATDTGAIAGAVVAVSAIARELGDQLEALDINPLICGPGGAVAVDVLAVRRAP